MAPWGSSKSRFHAVFSHKSRLEISLNSCSRKAYPITLNARLIYHAITQFFIQFPFSRYEICLVTPSRFALAGPTESNKRWPSYCFGTLVASTKNSHYCHLDGISEPPKQGGGKRLLNYHLVGENCVFVVENLFHLPVLVGEIIFAETLCRSWRCKFHLY